MDQSKIFPLRRLLPPEVAIDTNLYRNKAVFSLFERYCPLLMRDARRCIEANEPDQNLVSLFGFTIPGSWLTSVFLCLRRVEKILQNSGLPEWEMPYLFQVKEKWNELRIYVRYPGQEFPQIEKIIEECELKFVNSDS